MLEYYFKRVHLRQRLQGNLLADVWVEFVGHLDRQGHAKATIQAYVQVAEHFGHWLRCTGRTAGDVTPVTVQSFLQRHLPHCHCPPPHARYLSVVRTALHHLLVAMAPVGVPGPAPTPIGATVAAFDAYLRETCGLAAATRCYYVRYVRELLKTRFGIGPVDLSLLTQRDICAFISACATRMSPASVGTVTTAMAGFLRYLQFRGVGDTRWAGAFPRSAVWSLATLPRVLTDAEVEAFLAAFDPTTAVGRRGYAIALCFILLGLRTAEVARLTLDDIDWRAQKLTLAAGKTRRVSQLPLPAAAAAALADYLLHGRPQTTERAVFVRHRSLRGTPLGPLGVGRVVHQGFARSGIGPCVPGTHALRHTAATRMLRAGASLKEIADVLGHRQIDTSARYAKVDRTMLTGVALPWPEVQP